MKFRYDRPEIPEDRPVRSGTLPVRTGTYTGKERLSAEKIARIPHAKDVPPGAKDKGLCMNCGEAHWGSACPKECIRCEDNHTGAQCPKNNRAGSLASY